MKHLVPLLFLILSIPMTSALAGIYKSVGPNGEVIYTDIPDGKGESVQLRKGSEISFPTYKEQARDLETKVNEPEGEGKGKAFAGYQSLNWSRPSSDDTVWDDSGTIIIELKVNPPLQTQQGHRIAITLDGTRLPTRYTSPKLSLQNIDRGTHTLAATIIDSQGRKLISAPATTVHLKRHSALTHKR